jgi:glycerol-3-phosphate acyltransferase PlsY
MNIIPFSLLASSERLPVLFNLTDWCIKHFQLSPDSAWYFLTYAVGALACILIPYLIGSINPAILISREVYHEDIRQYGSGNAGSTNMLRTYGKKAAGLTFACDFLKAVISCFLGLLIWEMNGLGLAGFFVIFGHMYPIFEKFRGGKGVACLCAVVLITSIFTNNWIAPFIPFTFIFLALVFLAVVIGTQYVSMASVTGAFLYPVILKSLSNGEQAGLCVAMAALSAVFVIFKHRENLKRIYNRTESKINFKKTSKKKIENSEGEQP